MHEVREPKRYVLSESSRFQALQKQIQGLVHSYWRPQHEELITNPHVLSSERQCSSSDGRGQLRATSKQPPSKLHTTFQGHTGSSVLTALSWVLQKLFSSPVSPSGFPDHTGTTLWPMKTSDLNRWRGGWHTVKPSREGPAHRGQGVRVTGAQTLPSATLEPIVPESAANSRTFYSHYLMPAFSSFP